MQSHQPVAPGRQRPDESGMPWPTACCLLPRGRWSPSMASSPCPGSSCQAACTDRADAVREIRGGNSRCRFPFVCPHAVARGGCHLGECFTLPFWVSPRSPGRPWDFSNFVTNDYLLLYFAHCYFNFFNELLFFIYEQRTSLPCCCLESWLESLWELMWATWKSRGTYLQVRAVLWMRL